MKTNTIALVLEAALQAFAAGQRYTQMAQRAAAEGRELNATELRELRLDDDAARERQVQAIKDAEARESAAAKPAPGGEVG
jgi:hypothetical protein